MRESKIFVTVDAVIFKIVEEDYFVLLIKRKNDPFKDMWALPGGFVDHNEDLEVAARRELFEETQLKVDTIAQLHTFGAPFRDPRSHTISVAYTGFVENDVVPVAADDAKEVQWFSVKELPKLAFDHFEIITFALRKLDLTSALKS